jgi:predicted porin
MTKVRASVGARGRASALGLAAAATLLAVASAQADVTLYGEAKLSINGDNNVPGAVTQNSGPDLGQNNVYMASNQSKFGIKGSEDLGNGLKAIFQFAWELDPTETKYPGQNNTLVDQDQFVGLEGNFGRMVFGSVATSYKGSGKAIDPLYETSLQDRDFPGIQSQLQRGSGKYGGRETNTVQYESPSFMGLSLVAQSGLDETSHNNNSYGAGLHYNNGPFLAFYDYINGNLPQADNAIEQPQSVKQAAQKLGGRWTFGQYALFGQYEFDNGLITQSRVYDSSYGRFAPFLPSGPLGSSSAPTVTGDGGNTWFAGASAKFGNTLLVLEYGQALQTKGHSIATGADFKLPSSSGWVVGARQYLSKRTDVYAGWTSYDPNQGDTENRWTIGIDHKF